MRTAKHKKNYSNKEAKMKSQEMGLDLDMQILQISELEQWYKDARKVLESVETLGECMKAIKENMRAVKTLPAAMAKDATRMAKEHLNQANEELREVLESLDA